MFPFFFFFWPFEIILGTDVPILGAYVCKAPVWTQNILFHENKPKKIDDVISYNIFNNYSTSPIGLWVKTPWDREGERNNCFR